VTDEVTGTGTEAAGEAAPAEGVAPEAVTTTEAANEAATSFVSTDPNPAQSVPMATDASQVQVPEGLAVDDAAMQNFLGVLDNADMTGEERASALLDINAQSVSQTQEAMAAEQEQLWQDTQTEWRDAINNDPEIGGTHLPETTAKIAEVLDRFGTPEVRQAFDVTGAGNHPEIVRFLANIGALISEGGQVSGSPADAPRTQAQRMFGST